MKRVLCIDDEPVSLMVLADLLSDEFEVATAGSGEAAMVLLMGGLHPDIILLDIVMNGMSGYDLCQHIKSDPALCEIPVLYISSLSSGEDEARGLEMGAEDFIHKPYHPTVAKARVHTHLQLADARRQLQRRNEDLEALVAERTGAIVKKTEQLLAAQSAVIAAFCALAETRDEETGNHIRRTQHYVRVLAEALHDHPRFSAGLDAPTIELYYRSAPLHDIGKVAIPDAILNKPGKLTAEEWEIMKTHAYHGYNAISITERSLMEATGDSFLKYAGEIAYSHHEKWDGSGYPQGLAGDAIPLSARLMAVADVYDALISRRTYKAPFPHEKAMEILAEGVGKHFDPDIAAAALRIGDRFREIAEQFSD